MLSNAPLERDRANAPLPDEAPVGSEGLGAAASFGPPSFAPSTESDSTDGVPPPPETISGFAGKRWLRRLVSVCLLYHVIGIFVAPAAVDPSSRLMRSTWQLFRPYLQTLYLNHGFHFFAPEPSYSTLVGFTLEFPDGRVETGRFPNRGIQPRLMYHRHFMLTEYLGFVRDEEEGAWHRSYARHLGKASGATHVSLSRITHYLPTPQAVLEGATLNDSENFAEVPLGRFACDEL
jgi:hypothetical protein